MYKLLLRQMKVALLHDCNDIPCDEEPLKFFHAKQRSKF